MMTGGQRSRGGGEGYDESQRAEILMTTQDAPTEGLLQVNLMPDLDEDDGEDDDIDSFGAEMPEIRQER